MNNFIQVFLRMRPLNSRESSLINDDKIQIQGNNIQIKSINEVLSFNFDRIFNKEDQSVIFEEIAKKIVDSTIDGYNSTIFSYGPTGTGKSYTMFGTDKNSGIIPRVCVHIFSLLSKKEIFRYEVKISFIEIYCEQIRDMLAFTNVSLKLRESNRDVYIDNVIEKTVSSPEDILETLRQHSINRITASTILNNTSSRSHAVVTLKIIQNMMDGSSIISKMHLVDLAGSENVGKSQSKGINLVEAQMINKSLSALGNVIYALTDKKTTHIPYRDSKLTFFLRDAIGGNSKSALIATTTFSEDAMYETINTLRFAQRAKNIKNDPKINRLENNLTLNITIQELLEKIADLEKKYQDALTTIQYVETKFTPPVDKQALLFKKKYEKVNEQISLLEKEIIRKEEDNKQLEELFNTQRQDADMLNTALCDERIKHIEDSSLLKRYSMLIKAIKENIDNTLVIQVMIKNFTENE